MNEALKLGNGIKQLHDAGFYYVYVTDSEKMVVVEKESGLHYRVTSRNTILYEIPLLYKKVVAGNFKFFPLMKKLASMTDKFDLKTRSSKNVSTGKYSWYDGFVRTDTSGVFSK